MDRKKIIAWISMPLASIVCLVAIVVMESIWGSIAQAPGWAEAVFYITCVISISYAYGYIVEAYESK
mgnify:CR=1 FL=1